jgi:hypothetical protein
MATRRMIERWAAINNAEERELTVSLYVIKRLHRKLKQLQQQFGPDLGRELFRAALLARRDRHNFFVRGAPSVDFILESGCGHS